VKSELGKGSIFDIYFPRFINTEITEVEADQPIPGGTEKVLFIDDDPELVAIGVQILEKLGYRVVAKTDSLEALDLFRAEPDQFDLVITDLTMPRMTGDKLAEEIMKIKPEISIILCTGYSERISDREAEKIGIREFVMKPIAMRDLANIIRRVLDLN
jgi:CheY-like chemotaxis protein